MLCTLPVERTVALTSEQLLVPKRMASITRGQRRRTFNLVLVLLPAASYGGCSPVHWTPSTGRLHEAKSTTLVCHAYDGCSALPCQGVLRINIIFTASPLDYEQQPLIDLSAQMNAIHDNFVGTTIERACLESSVHPLLTSRRTFQTLSIFRYW